VSAPAEESGAVTRHRRSRRSEHDRYHFVYTLYSAIMPEAARASFRHGIVEIHLPKARMAPMPIVVSLDLHDDSSLPLGHAESVSIHGAGAVVFSAHEGSPGQKLGAAYVPNAGEDHTTKARSIGELTPAAVPALATSHAPHPAEAGAAGPPRRDP